ncbi:hypothetical protein Sru01_51970 [Sphaerisporangium rufum]|uniref:Uncharacterized protein n=1 Tax=Sphaerisporangium rufum TaxID=1381558 RepID=A0A919R8N2_9ACTN|nr:hypothetical protein [Sphaerisporangium rufum]GII80215.1 hypothetical protein Sru01_51970 [Sphaerisporangium rufum]
MKDIDRLDAALRPLARVTPGTPPAGASGAGARSLLATILAEDPAREPSDAAARPRPARRYPVRRFALGAAAAAAIATGIVAGPGLLSGATPSYAVSKDADGVVYVTIRDFTDPGGLRRQLRDLDVPAIVDYAPPGRWCREPRGEHVADIPAGLYSVPENIPGEEHGNGWRMRIDTKLFRPGETFVWTISDNSTSTILMRGPVSPCVLIPSTNNMIRTMPPSLPPELDKVATHVATVKGGSLAGFRVDEKTVGEVLPELRRRGLRVEFVLMAIAQGNPGGYGVLGVRKKPVGDDWIVWEANEDRPSNGVVQLLVTKERYDRNPVYAGPRDAIIKE